MKIKSVIAATLLLIVVLAIVFTGCGETADLTEISKKIEEMQGKIEGLEQENDGLGSQVSNLQSDVESLGERVKKLESSVNLINTLDKRISALEAAGGDATQFEQLKIQVQNLQADLIANKASDDAIKALATQMQLKLDEISTNIGEIDFVETLNSIQKDITQLYGEVDRTIEFENGKEYEVKLNGVVYYTVTIEVEYHKGKVSSSSLDLGLCNNNGLHWCGNIEIYNVGTKTIEELQMANMMSIVVDDDVTHGIGIFKQKNGQAISGEDAVIRPGERKRWYFGTSTISKHPSNSMGFSFKVDQGEKLTLLVLENVWDGVQEPIIGEVV